MCSDPVYQDMSLNRLGYLNDIYSLNNVRSFDIFNDHGYHDIDDYNDYSYDVMEFNQETKDELEDDADWVTDHGSILHEGAERE